MRHFCAAGNGSACSTADNAVPGFLVSYLILGSGFFWPAEDRSQAVLLETLKRLNHWAGCKPSTELKNMPRSLVWG